MLGLPKGWLFWVVLLSACTTVPRDGRMARSERPDTTSPAVDVSTYGRFTVPSQSRYSWLPEAVNYYQRPEFGGTGMEFLLREVIYRQLKAKGLRFVGAPALAQFWVSYTAVLDQPVTDRALQEIYEVRTAAAVKDREAFDRGMIIIDFIDPQQRQVVWRSVAQAGITMETDTRLRKERVAAVVARMVAQLPVE